MRVFHVRYHISLMAIFVAHEAAIHTAQLRVELSQSRKEQREYLKNVELARVLNKRAENKRKTGQDVDSVATSQSKRPRNERADAEVKERVIFFHLL